MDIRSVMNRKFILLLKSPFKHSHRGSGYTKNASVGPWGWSHEVSELEEKDPLHRCFKVSPIK